MQTTTDRQAIHEEAARKRKVARLIAGLLKCPRTNHPHLATHGYTADEVEAFSASEWDLAAGIANVRLPSEQTRSEVVAELRRVEAVTDDGDPFAGLVP